jgi:cytochrome c biogenesis protein CcmG/thiol:disulfide interchange protein DsbE
MPRRLAFLLPAVLFALLLAAFAVGLRHDPHVLPSALINRPAPSFSLPALYQGADALTRDDLDGRVTLVNFFASWCAPCREEHAQLMALSRRPGVILDGIAYKDKPEEARRFLDLLGNPYRHIGVDRSGTTAIDFGVYGVPETYVIDSSGRIRYRHVGPLNPEDVSAKILPLIERLTVPDGMPEASKRPG